MTSSSPTNPSERAERARNLQSVIDGSLSGRRQLPELNYGDGDKQPGKVSEAFRAHGKGIAELLGGAGLAGVATLVALHGQPKAPTVGSERSTRTPERVVVSF